jgi:uncharacterized membrane protein
MLGAFGAKSPLSIILVLMAKGCWALFVVAFFWNREKRIKQKKDFEDFMRWRNRKR